MSHATLHTPSLESGFCGSNSHMIKCRGARAADGSLRFITGILPFYREKEFEWGFQGEA